MTEPFQPFLQRCVSVDLEVDPATATIFAFAAVRDDARPPILAKKRDLMAALDRLEAESAEAEHLLGHSIIRTPPPIMAHPGVGATATRRGPTVIGRKLLCPPSGPHFNKGGKVPCRWTLMANRYASGYRGTAALYRSKLESVRCCDLMQPTGFLILTSAC